MIKLQENYIVEGGKKRIFSVLNRRILTQGNTVLQLFGEQFVWHRDLWNEFFHRCSSTAVTK